MNHARRGNESLFMRADEAIIERTRWFILLLVERRQPWNGDDYANGIGYPRYVIVAFEMNLYVTRQRRLLLANYWLFVTLLRHTSQATYRERGIGIGHWRLYRH